jgi:hypothetical protein
MLIHNVGNVITDAVFTPCGEYTYFCCGQDTDARSCCDSGNNTINIGGGEALCNGTVINTVIETQTAIPTAGNSIATSCPTPQSSGADLDKKTNIVTGLAVALGCLGLGFGVLAWDWNRKRKQLVLPPSMRTNGK